MHNRTKLVCTIGPSVDSLEKIETLILAGMNVARLNFSHGSQSDHEKRIGWLKQARKNLQKPLAIMLDTKGPEIRIGKLKEPINLQKGDYLWFVKEEVIGDPQGICVTPSYALDVLKKDMFVFLDDGYIITHVVEIQKNKIKVEVDHGGILGENKGVNIPGADINLPALTEKDKADIKLGCFHDVDYIAASFIRSAEHVMLIKKLLEEEGKNDILVIAKIENSLGVQNYDAIVQVADGIMIARGDLGVELPLTVVPRLQKMMIRKANLAGKPSVTATQMLESMIKNPRPTRAETSDVANAIYDSTSAVMLSGETAVGKYPIEAVRVMEAIIEETEKDFNYHEFLKQNNQRVFPDVPSSITMASIRTAYSSNAKAIFAFSTSGSTARLLARFRPEIPIIAMTPNEKVYHQLALVWGVIPILCDEVEAHSETIDKAYAWLSEYSLKKGYVRYGDLVVITAGNPFGRAGTTNMMIVDSIGDVLVRGNEGLGRRISGKIAIVSSPENRKDYEVRGKIIIINSCDASYLPLIKEASAIILQNHIDDTASEEYLKDIAKSLGISILLRAEGASSVLREEQLITLDPEQAIIYKGVF